MDDDLDQLMKGLKLRRMREILDHHLEWAEGEGPSYADFLRRLLREEYQTQQMRFLGHRIRRAKLPEHWALESFPWDRQPGVQRAVIEQLARLGVVQAIDASDSVTHGEDGPGLADLDLRLVVADLLLEDLADLFGFDVHRQKSRARARGRARVRAPSRSPLFTRSPAPTVP